MTEVGIITFHKKLWQQYLQHFDQWTLYPARNCPNDEKCWSMLESSQVNRQRKDNLLLKIIIFLQLQQTYVDEYHIGGVLDLNDSPMRLAISDGSRPADNNKWHCCSFFPVAWIWSASQPCKFTTLEFCLDSRQVLHDISLLPLYSVADHFLSSYRAQFSPSVTIRCINGVVASW